MMKLGIISYGVVGIMVRARVSCTEGPSFKGTLLLLDTLCLSTNSKWVLDIKPTVKCGGARNGRLRLTLP